ncbi:YchJ family protein [Dokdonella sp.]|uniref:YchJ family protein n=1 Tax=Dokdonella sp. TaxID=2291710 RepID=UPI003C6AF214
MTRPLPDTCPCDMNRIYADCCGRWHTGSPAPDAESLMRSRYGAYVLGLAHYLMATRHPSTRPTQAELGLASNNHTTWLELKIKDRLVTGSDSAEIEFIARYREGGGGARRLHERSRFVRAHGQWYYVDGDIDPSA